MCKFENNLWRFFVAAIVVPSWMVKGCIFFFPELAHLSQMCKRLIWATRASFCRRETCDTALEPSGSKLLTHEHPQVCAHIRHILCTHQAHYAKKIPFFDDFCHICFMCLMCADTSETIAALKLLRVDLKLSNEHCRSFVAQKLVPVAQIEIWWKFWKIDFRMKTIFLTISKKLFLSFFFLLSSSSFFGPNSSSSSSLIKKKEKKKQEKTQNFYLENRISEFVNKRN